MAAYRDRLADLWIARLPQPSRFNRAAKTATISAMTAASAGGLFLIVNPEKRAA